MKIKRLLIAGFMLVSTALVAQNTYQWKTATSGGYTYKYVSNDPSKSRFYTLKNGLTVILSPNNKEPKVFYRMTVRAGSNTDPKNATGLAHYLEHVLFKGTDKFGTKDWAKEKPLLDKIDALYEKYNKTTDQAQRKEIYKEIDKVSGEASNYSIANEYDKMMTSIGGNTTNAHTWYEETVYKEDFPSNALDKFLAIQAERFRNPIFRIFHTELEAVYEEKNISLDDDNDKLDEAMMAKLFPTHNYGQQTTIGTIEHLKNPSILEIRKYYQKYYVPNNMAFILAGDINPDETIKKIDKAFSYMVSKPVSLYQPAAEKPLTAVQVVEAIGPSAESVNIYFRAPASNTRDALMTSLITSILSNGKAGFIDININKQQKLLRAGANLRQMKDYGVLNLWGTPRQGQSLEEAGKILLSQIELVKEGKFDTELLKAIVANRKLGFLQAFDDNANRVNNLSDVFVQNRGEKWAAELNENDVLAKITKAEVVAYAKSFLKDNYIIGYKRKGEDKNVVKVEKPTITPINPNAGAVSAFAKPIFEEKLKPLTPKFLDYKQDIAFGKAGIADVLAIKNTENAIFRMTYRFDIGGYNYKLLPYASQYLAYLGTDKYSAEELSKQFYNIACNYSLSVSNEITTLTVSGLQENFDKAVSLVEHIFANVQPNEKALSELKSTILKSRENAKLNKGAIMNGLTTYAQFGAKNPFNNVLSNDEVNNIKADDLIYLIKNLNNYEHVVTYYGPQDIATFSANLQKIHRLPKEFTPAAPATEYHYTKQDTSKVYFVNYDMVQSEVRWLRNTDVYDRKNDATIELFNNYFGGGMGSVVFQTIRESKALAYSTFAYYITPDKNTKRYSVIGYVGSQADKMNDAVNAMNELLSALPRNDKGFEGAKENIVSNLESERITKGAIFGSYFADRKLGYDTDSRIEKYNTVKAVTFDDISNFHKNNLAGKAYNYLIIASDKKVKEEDMAKFGTIEKLSLEQVFGY